MKAVLIKNGFPLQVVDTPKDIDWRWCRDQIGCEWIEIVRPRNLDKKFVMVIDEEGKLKSNEVNIPASWYYSACEHGDCIVGNVLILKEEDGPEGGELVGLTELEAGALQLEIMTNWSDWLDEVVKSLRKSGREVVGI